jgi:endonuclease/exonuclease/phosphatase family metal-dependent hydrolase
MPLHKTRIGKILPRLIRARGREVHEHGRKEKHHPAHEGSFRVVTYNIHKCRGLDRRVLPRRIIEVLREIDADIIALQEVVNLDDGPREGSQALYIAEELGFHHYFGENRRLDGGGYGNLILSRFPLVPVRNYDLSRQGREERGCQRADVVLPQGAVMHVYNAHLGTSYRERSHQGRDLVTSGALEGADLRGPRILLGDFNDWRLPGLASQLLSEHFGSADIRVHLGRWRTYPGPFPVVHLDHIYFDDLLVVERAKLHRSRKALVASDHLPIVADFHLKRLANVE